MRTARNARGQDGGGRNGRVRALLRGRIGSRSRSILRRAISEPDDPAEAERTVDQACPLLQPSRSPSSWDRLLAHAGCEMNLLLYD